MIKYLVMDVDGTLTDGKIYMSLSGELFRLKEDTLVSEGLMRPFLLPYVHEVKGGVCT